MTLPDSSVPRPLIRLTLTVLLALLVFQLLAFQRLLLSGNGEFSFLAIMNNAYPKLEWTLAIAGLAGLIPALAWTTKHLGGKALFRMFPDPSEPRGQSFVTGAGFMAVMAMMSLLLNTPRSLTPKEQVRNDLKVLSAQVQKLLSEAHRQLALSYAKASRQEREETLRELERKSGADVAEVASILLRSEPEADLRYRIIEIFDARTGSRISENFSSTMSARDAERAAEMIREWEQSSR